MHIDCVRVYYIQEVADKLGRLRPHERVEIEKTLKAIDEETLVRSGNGDRRKLA